MKVNGERKNNNVARKRKHCFDVDGDVSCVLLIVKRAQQLFLSGITIAECEERV